MVADTQQSSAHSAHFNSAVYTLTRDQAQFLMNSLRECLDSTE